MELPRHFIWAIIGAGLIAVGALNLNIGRRGADSLAPLVFKFAWLVMWLLILLGGTILVHAMLFMER